MQETSIYSRLYRYSQFKESSRLENFLTEALADLMSRLKPPLVADFVREVFLRNGAYGSEDRLIKLNDKLKSAQIFRWSTYNPVRLAEWQNTLYPDFFVFADSDEKPFLVIENKINARFTQASEQTLDGDLRGQMERYALWLHHQKVPNAALILLTHHTPPPDGFLESEKAFSGVARTVTYWRGLHSSLEGLCKKSLTAKVSTELLGEFLEFLTEMKMTDFSRGDLVAIGPYLSNDLHGKLEELMAFIWKQIQRWPAVSAYKHWGVHFENGTVRDAVGRDYRKSKLSVDWGFSSGDNPEIFQLSPPATSLQFFIYIQGSAGTLEGLKKARLDAWPPWGHDDRLEWRGQSEPAEKFLDRGSFTERAFEWLEPKIKDALHLLELIAEVK